MVTVWLKRSDMEITNRTHKPLSVPLPGGKKLFLGPAKTGQVSARALEFKPLVKLIEAGDIEATGDGSKRNRSCASEGPTPASQYN